VEKRSVVTKILAVAGTILAWFPLLAPILLSTMMLAASGMWRFDYLMPAELFPAALAGSVLLLWAALRAHAYVRLIAWGLGLAAVMLAGGQGLAVVTGLASGEIEPAGWPWLLVLASLGLYALGVLLVAIGGALLVRDLFRRSAPAR